MPNDSKIPNWGKNAMPNDSKIPNWDLIAHFVRENAYPNGLYNYF